MVPLADGPLPTAAQRLLTSLDPAPGSDAAVVANVVDHSRQLTDRAAR
jgi:hypothetical protein